MEKYPRLSKIPYHGTSVSEEKTKAAILTLLEKYGITTHQWTKQNDHEYIRFKISTVCQGREIQLAVHLDIPDIKARKGHGRGYIVSVPRSQVYRMFFYNLKSLLEATKYGIMKKEELLFSYILTQLPSGETVQMKDYLGDHRLLLAEQPDID